MDCASARLLVQAFHDDELSPSEAAYLLAHLEQCPPCADEHRTTGELKDVLTARRADTCPDEVRRKVASRLQRCRAESASPRLFRRRTFALLALGAGGTVLGLVAFTIGRAGEPAALRADAAVTTRVSGEVLCLRCALAKLYPSASFRTARHQLVLRTSDGRLFTLLPGKVPGLDSGALSDAASPGCQERHVDLVARLYPTCAVAEPLELQAASATAAPVAMK